MKDLWVGEHYRVQMGSIGNYIVLQVQLAGPNIFAGPGPGYTLCYVGPIVWWWPPTWECFRKDVDRSVASVTKMAQRMEYQKTNASKILSQYTTKRVRPTDSTEAA
jgi:hypothetical protein